MESKTSDGTANGLPLLRAKNSTQQMRSVDPHFDEDFLQGKNAFNTVLGKVYEDVSFPLKQRSRFCAGAEQQVRKRPGEQYAEYWYYDSSKASLYLKQDKGDGKYYLESPKDDDGKPTTARQLKKH